MLSEVIDDIVILVVIGVGIEARILLLLEDFGGVVIVLAG